MEYEEFKRFEQKVWRKIKSSFFSLETDLNPEKKKILYRLERLFENVFSFIFTLYDTALRFNNKERVCVRISDLENLIKMPENLL